MNDRNQPHSLLLIKMQHRDKEKLLADLRDIIADADQYVPEMKDNPTDEFLLHAGTIRGMAGELLEDCVKVSDSDQMAFTKIKERFEVLAGFVEYWCTLRDPEITDSASRSL